MALVKKLFALALALGFAWSAIAADDAAKAAPVAASPAAVQAPAAEPAAGQGSGRFVERAGTGSSKAVRTAAPVTLPAGPLGKPTADINKLIGEAQKAGGEPLDPIQKEINLPGLKKDDPSLKPFVLHTRNGVNEIVRLSGRLLNRIATPFKSPMVIDTSASDYKVVGSDIYYTPAGDKPIGLFIADEANTQQTISLTIIPAQDIPGQNLIVKLEDLRTVQNLAAAPSDAEAEILAPRASDYTGFVRTLMTQAVRGRITGFSPVPLEGGVARMGTLEVEPEVSFAGSVVDVYRYKLLNAGKERIDLLETAFYRKGVKAVSFFPRISLAPGEHSYVFLLADKPKAAASYGGEAQ
ncbi:type-F conjugative transfer system secretin TraK [Acidovorax sp. sic0104]|uniref:TraK domain-containing protein n=1 Tax=Acidovorax sp. sic0104 TaxID=2854784 RepID=UPI001C47B128|nr:type-F conjugative transfer system secretin TraK [Acidovorax sp. sic0104]MBV7542103.1 type-F conjugative transfer system secretin TraK [Acidovorax sp. sic0104]